MDGSDYSTPQDHYFAYISKKALNIDSQQSEASILADLNFTNVLTEPVARQILVEEPKEFISQKSKHSKKDYDNLYKTPIADIFTMSETKKKEVKFEDKPDYSTIVKIEKKKKKIKERK